MSCLGETIKVFRANRRMSLQDVATAAGLSKAHIWDLETGASSNPSIETLCKIGAALKMDVMQLCSASVADQTETIARLQGG